MGAQFVTLFRKIRKRTKMEELLEVKNLSVSIDSPAGEVQAVRDVSFSLKKGEVLAIVGESGCGKSTLGRVILRLQEPDSGNIYYDGQDIYEKGFVMKNLRSKVGLVFQYPEHQLFESDVFTDVCFGPKNLGLDKKDVELRAFEALEMVGFPKELFYNSPFELSGGQKRRAAIAGVLAMKPEVLILDEPTAGLDPKGRDEILDQIKKLHEETGITVILVSHSMEDVAKYVGRLIVLDHGRVMYDDIPKKVFRNYRELEKIGLAAPQLTYIMNDLKANGFDVDTDAITMEEAVATVKKALGGFKC